MKVVRLTTLLDFGGQERQYISLSESNPELLQNEYIFAAIGHGGHAEQIIRNNGFQVVIFNSKPKIYNFKNIWMLYKWFKKLKPDVVHTAAAEANFHGILAAKIAGVSIIIGEEIGFPNHSFTAKIVFRMLYKLANKIVCVSQAVKEFLLFEKEINDSKGIVIYNPVSQIKPLHKVLSDEFIIVTVGRFEKVKNQALLIKAFSKIDNNSARLILVGDGSERNNLEALVQSLKLENRVTFTGFVENPEQYLSQANLFVLPSFSEGFGIAVVEAMQQEIACLCSNVGGIPEFISHNETGWLFDPNNESALVSQLNQILEMPITEIEKIAQKGKLSIQNRFSVEQYVKRIENLYSSKND